MSRAGSAPGAGGPSLTPATRQRIRRSKALYPSARSAVLPALWAVQEQLGYLAPEGLAAVAVELGLEPSEVEAVSTFYSMYFQHQPGRHLIQVCRNVSCGLRGADELLRHLETTLGVEDGQTTADGAFTLEGTVECLGACGGAPMMQVDRYSYENLDFERASQILVEVRARAKPAKRAGSDA
ncbi:MAG TPA: NAD(P)H-dependent oxidoreductase subunit E [Candidatus Dormibacteraeota bacterium]|nr:NAD(P)H-dependent oxidoreductase subunit E [Candidatus Dormibacteraeota bacterium]